ncbi:MAG: hypothetical protein ACUVX8_12705, partial [Candidatus Zipacnadales bacterium]
MFNASAVTLIAFCASSAVVAQMIPNEWSVIVVDPGESPTGFTPRSAADFTDCRLTTTESVSHQGRSVEWKFTPAPGVETVGLTHGGNALSNRGAISLWIKNPQGHPLTLGLQLTDADGQMYESRHVPIDDQHTWRQLVFLTDDLVGAANICYPIRTLGLVLAGILSGKTYTLYLDDFLAHIAPPETLEVTKITAPPTARVGDILHATVGVRPASPLRRAYWFKLALMSAGVSIAEAEVPFTSPSTAWPAALESTSEQVTLTVPSFLASGEYTLRLIAPGIALEGEAALGVSLRVEHENGDINPLTVQVADHNGAPTLVVNGRPLSLLGQFCLPEQTARPDIPLIILPATATHDPYAWATDVWLGPDNWSYEALDRAAIEALQASPGAFLILRVFLEAPDWWDEQNAGEMILYGHGRHAIVVPGVPGKQTYASFSSLKWRKAAKEALRRFINHVETAPYANRVVGYILAGGEEGRWRYWGAAEGVYPDYSRPQRVAFITWLREKYSNDIRQLRIAWQQIINPILGGPLTDNNEVAIPVLAAWEDIVIPSEKVRASHPSGELIDPTAAPEVVDYNLFHADQVAGLIAELAAVAKEACGNNKIVGVSYGHILEHARSAEALQTAGHIALDRIFTDPHIDLIAGPPVQGDNGEGVWSSLAASVKAHGKVWVEEILPSDGLASLDAIAVCVLATGGNLWLVPPAGGEGLDRLLKIANAVLTEDRHSVAEIALLVDHYSLAYLAEGKALSAPLLTDQCISLAQVGAPFDVWLLDDLLAGRMPKYKLYVMANAFYLDAEARNNLRNLLARDGQMVVWVYAAGALDETLSGRTALDLTDLAISFVPKAGKLRVKIIDAAHPAIDGVPKNFEYGPLSEIGPVFFALPTRGEALGVIEVPSQLAKGQPSRWAGLVLAESENWTTIFSAAPNVPAPILQPLARRAGVH